jgi:hypothetical protein
MGRRVLILAALAPALAGCGAGDPAPAPTTPHDAPAAGVVARPAADAAVARLEVALRHNPNAEARSADCRRPTAADRRIADASFGSHPRHLFACVITLGALPPATYDIMMVGRCFVGHRRGANAADYGCLRRS